MQVTTQTLVNNSVSEISSSSNVILDNVTSNSTITFEDYLKMNQIEESGNQEHSKSEENSIHQKTEEKPAEKIEEKEKVEEKVSEDTKEETPKEEVNPSQIENQQVLQNTQNHNITNKEESNFKKVSTKDSKNVELKQDVESSKDAKLLNMDKLESLKENHSEKGSEFNMHKDNSSKTKVQNEPKIQIDDQRTKVDTHNSISKEENTLQTEVKFLNENTAVMTMDYSSTENSVQATPNDFQSMLNSSIQNNIPDFVKTGSIILKDSDHGTINLVLHPEDLGNVKIHLSLDGKTISGHIIVATKEAAEVFKDNAQTLREAFGQSGFEASNFDVSYNNSSNSSGNFSNEYDGREFVAKQFFGASDNSIDTDLLLDKLISDSSSDYSINIIA